MAHTPYHVDPDDPRAPPQEVWDQLTPEEQARIVDSLPSEFPVSEAHPPEGDPHYEAKVRAREVLGGFFSRVGRKVYLACELPVYYPGENMFAPDVIAVLDVEHRARMRWMVSTEKKGVDLALEVMVAGERRKDLERNVERYARLGIREYFVFDRGRLRLNGWRLEAGRRSYTPILPQHGVYRSEVLGLDLQIDDERLRFYFGGAPLPEAHEMISRLEHMVERVEASRLELEHQLAEEMRRREEETRRRKEETRRREEATRLQQEETQRREEATRLQQEETRRREEATRLQQEETQRREDAERRLAEALAELEQLRGTRK
ncbi:Uma2 family endonuclease [Myxococcus sp. AS-1-15]|jgi:Uma2 family endonuclease|uniref:Uma2 family endonuclease n=1 Tax=Myxococcus TaxID=32 RepID=UPI001CC049D8|nr:Uma2 family endonuclease [Myxococcus sp. AS-1-15]MBZ4396605.1 Uma2 family endonuclease [Myxococcus sp. AS-1-15]